MILATAAAQRGMGLNYPFATLPCFCLAALVPEYRVQLLSQDLNEQFNLMSQSFDFLPLRNITVFVHPLFVFILEITFPRNQFS